MKHIAYVILCCSLIACSNANNTELVGADRDEHGCIGSAGYTWCKRTQRCERPWELAKKVGLEDSGIAIAKYCSSKATSHAP